VDPSWEVRRNPDGSVDEIVAKGCSIHLEQMDKGVWYLGIYADDTPDNILQVDIYRRGKKRVVVDPKYGPDEFPVPPLPHWTDGRYHGCNCQVGYECRQDGCPCECHWTTPTGLANLSSIHVYE
jgi:hypothetical protein